MDLNKVKQLQDEKDHQMRHGHLSQKDRDSLAMHHMYQDKYDKNYHSPDHVDGEMEGVDPNSHGVELQ